MPVRLRIALLFSLFVFIILSIVCGGIYYFSYQSRLNTIKTRLTNRAITTAALLNQREIFDRELIRRIDSSTTIALKNKSVQAYDYQDNRIYSYSDVAGDTLKVSGDILDNARVSGTYFFIAGEKESIAYHYAGNNMRMVVIVAAEDEEGKQNLVSLSKILAASFFNRIIFCVDQRIFFFKKPFKAYKKNIKRRS